MIAIASSSASNASRFVRSGRPMPATAFQKFPAPEPELESAAAHDVHRRRGLGDHRWVAHRQARDVGEEPEPLGPRQQIGDQRIRVEVAPLIRVILDADEVEAALLRDPHPLDDALVVRRVRHDRQAESQRPGHQSSSSSFVLRDISSATAAIGGRWSKTTARTCSAIGSSTPCSTASSSAPATVATPSATPASRSPASGHGTPEAISSPALPVARQRRHAGRDQVAHARQPGERQRLRPRRDAEARHLGQAARDDPGLRRVSEAEPVDHAGCQRHDVLQRARQLDPGQIGIRIDPEPIRRQDRCELRRQLAILGSHDRSGRLAAGDLARQVRPRQGGNAPARELLGGHLAHPQMGPFLDALHDAQQRGIGMERGRQAPKGAAQMGGRGGQHEEPMRLGEVGVIGRDAEIRREDDAGQISVVRALVGELLGRLGRMRPEADRALRIGQEHGQGRAPRARTDDADLIGHAAEDISARFSACAPPSCAAASTSGRIPPTPAGGGSGGSASRGSRTRRGCGSRGSACS